MTELKAKAAAYAKRQLSGVASPPPTDSDDDFNNGAIVIEEKQKRGKKLTKKSSSRTAVKRKPARNDYESSADEVSYEGDVFQSKNKRAKRMSPSRQVHIGNPLAEFFADDELDPEPAASDDGDNDNEVEEHSGSEDDSSLKVNADPDILRSSLVNSETARKLGPKTVSAVPPVESDHDSNDEVFAMQRKRKNPALLNPNMKRVKLSPVNTAAAAPPVQAEESVTESESSVTEPENNEEAITLVVKPHPAEDESVTEYEDSEPEPEPPSRSNSKPRPGFPLANGQKIMGPFSLGTVSVPAPINTYLRDYQREGVQFFWDQYSQGLGALLGDDMGLGKTIQVIAFLSAIMSKTGYAKDRNRRREHVSKLQDGEQWQKTRTLPPANATWPTCLIIAPSTVVHNWNRELETWGYFEFGLFTTENKNRHETLNDFRKGRLDVVLTTFDLARRDIDELCDLPWSCIFVDEAHKVKNPNSKITQAYNRFECTRRFGLTGTAIQNNYDELYTLLDWTNPGHLGSMRQWRAYISKPLTNGQSASASADERTKAATVANILHTKILPRFFIRRTKARVQIQLPKKIDHVVFCPLTSFQIMAYKRILAEPGVQNLLCKDEPCDCRSGKLRKRCCYKFDKGSLLKFLNVLIKISNHLCLVLPGSPKDSAEQTERNRELSQMAFGDTQPKYGAAMMESQYCGKWRTLEMLLSEWKKEKSSKVLIFTKSVKLIEMLDFHLKTKNYGFLTLDGSTKQLDRMPLIDQFNTDPNIYIFLISTLAGGTGLNLTSANKVVIFDPNWNPAHDLQAIDRAYRFGQTRDVKVYRLLGAGSIEELIYARQIYKQQQMAIGYDASIQTRYFEGVQNDTSKQGELFGLKNIFTLREGDLTTKQAIETAHLAELDWAMANLGGSAAVAQPKAKDEESDLQALGALLLDGDDQVDPDMKALLSIGVKYAHRNDDVLIPSRMEADKLEVQKKRTQKKARKSKDGKTVSDAEKPEWPPRRSRNKDKRLEARQMALIELGFITSPDGLPQFAQGFKLKSDEEQRLLLGRLDAWKPDY